MLLKEPATLFLRRLGIRLPEEAEVQPPGDLLDLDGLAVWKIRDALLPVRLEGGDEVKALESLAHAGHIPRGQLGRELEHGWSEKLPAPPVPVLSPSQRFQPALRILAEPSRLVSGQAQYLWYLVSDPEPVLRHYSVSSDSIEKRLPLFLEALCMAANEPTTTKFPARGQLYFQGAKPIDFAIPDSVSAKALLQQLLPLYDLAQSRPLPFWPGSAQMLLALKSEAPDTHPAVADLLEHYREKWEADGSFGVSGEIQKPHTRFAFRGCPNPFVLMAPESEAAFLPDPAHPLSWRLVQFIRNWCLTAGLPLTKSHV
jgi:exonuclease V gamma subunit